MKRSVTKVNRLLLYVCREVEQNKEEARASENQVQL